MDILTAGYGNLGFERFIERLKQHSVTHLVDVRSVPQSSYWEDFRRQNMERLVPSAGLRYVYMGDTLGGVRDSPVLCKDPGSFDIEPLFDRSEFLLGVEKLIKAASDERRKICLMCGCLRPHLCHRSRLIGPALESRGITVWHLDEEGHAVTQAQVALERPPKQEALF